MLKKIVAILLFFPIVVGAVSVSEIIGITEKIIRSNGTNFVMKFRNPAEYARRNSYFDLDNSGYVTVTDELIVRNKSYSKQGANKLLKAFCDNVHPKFAFGGGKTITFGDYVLFRNALVSGVWDENLTQIIESEIRKHMTHFMTPIEKRQLYNSYYDLNDNGYVTVTDELLARDSRYSETGAKKLLKAVCDNFDGAYILK